MKTIETIATVDKAGKLIIEITSDLPPGDHRAVIVIDESLSSQPASSSHVDAARSEVITRSTTKKTAWTVLRINAGSVEMPEDWAKEHDHYLYGTPKREG